MLEGMKTLRDLLGEEPLIVKVAPEASVRTAAKAMAFANVGSIVVMEGERLVGMFTERDLLKRVLLQDRRTDETRVQDVMTTELITARPETTSAEARRILDERHIRHLPVVESEDRLLGVLSIRDLIHDEVEAAREDVEHVRRYVQDGGEPFA
jgi:CBS domain-containing protein